MRQSIFYNFIPFFFLAVVNATVLRHKYTHHERLTKRELEQVFGTEVQEQGEVFPSQNTGMSA